MSNLNDFCNQKFDIIILAGQSNAEGCGFGPVENEYQPTDKIMWFWDGAKSRWQPNGDGTDTFVYEFGEMEIKVGEERVWDNLKHGNISLIFAQDYLNKGLLAPDRKLLVVYAPIGGTSFVCNQWGIGKGLYNRLLEYTDKALSLNPENRIVAFLWHQGEGDACADCYKTEQDRFDYYYNSLGSMLDHFNDRYNCKGIPLVAGAFCNEWYLKNKVACDTVLDASRKIVAERGGRFVETADLDSNDKCNGGGDDIHFCRYAVYELGHRYFDAYLQIIGKK